MSSRLPNNLATFIDEIESKRKTLLLLNRTEPRPLVNLLDRAFENQSIRIEERHVPEGEDNLVCLIENGEVTATTQFSTLSETFLLVNADLYRTGTTQSETRDFPAVLTGLDDIEFTVRGYPMSDKEKLLLILISRFIEDRALACGSGELHSTFQQLSRLDDEYGTKTMYEWLGNSDVNTHVYGVRDDPDAVDDLDLTVHDGTNDEYRHSWVVLFKPDTDDCQHVALVAIETAPNVWRSMWTYEPDRVERIHEYMLKNF